jgi:AcrR family transcriptional regulator
MTRAADTERRQEAVDRRDLILQAAVRCFARRGYNGASTREIAEQAGVADTLLFYYFKGKAGLYLAAVRDQLEKLQQGIERETGDASGTQERLRRFVATYLAYFLDLEPGLTVVLRELVGVPPEIADQIRQLHHAIATQRLEHILAEGVRQGTLRPLNLPVCALTIIAILQGFIRREATPPGATARADVIAQVMEHYYRGLLPGSAG